MKSLILLTVLTLFGCGTQYWHNSNNGANFNNDNYQCLLEARRNTVPVGSQWEYDNSVDKLRKSCLYARGWYLDDK